MSEPRPGRPLAPRDRSIEGPGTTLPAVGVTGVGVAAIRAAESSRPDRLFDDPYAAPLAAAAGWDLPRLDRSRDGHLSNWIAVRTRFLDDFVMDACAGGCRQVVVLGAGLDARAFRLGWPAGTRLFELDLPPVLEFKERVVAEEGWQPACDRCGLAVDLAGDWRTALVHAGFDPGSTTAWVAEGLLAYLTEEAAGGLLSVAAELSVPGSRMGLTVASPERLQAWREAHPRSRGDADPGDEGRVPTGGSERSGYRRGDYTKLWKSGAPEDAVGWLASLGWRAALYETAERAAAYGRRLGDTGEELAGARLLDAVRL